MIWTLGPADTPGLPWPLTATLATWPAIQGLQVKDKYSNIKNWKIFIFSIYFSLLLVFFYQVPSYGHISFLCLTQTLCWSDLTISKRHFATEMVVTKEFKSWWNLPTQHRVAAKVVQIMTLKKEQNIVYQIRDYVSKWASLSLINILVAIIQWISCYWIYWGGYS